MSNESLSFTTQLLNFVETMPEKSDLVAVDSLSETKDIEFKSWLDLKDQNVMLELLKDIVAMANSGGGLILFAVKDDGQPSQEMAESAFKNLIDLATIQDKLFSVTRQRRVEISWQKRQRFGVVIPALKIEGLTTPLVFSETRTQENKGDQKPKTIFHKGTIYLRFGPKVEAITNEQLNSFFEGYAKNELNKFLQVVTMVHEKPKDTVIQIVPASERTGVEKLHSINLTNDSAAPVFRGLPIDELYPFRCKESIAYLKKNGIDVNQSQFVSLVKLFKAPSNPNWAHYTRHNIKLYSEEFLKFLVKKITDEKILEQIKTKRQRIDL